VAKTLRTGLQNPSGSEFYKINPLEPPFFKGGSKSLRTYTHKRAMSKADRLNRLWIGRALQSKVEVLATNG